jgi:hypothetical protein
MKIDQAHRHVAAGKWQETEFNRVRWKLSAGYLRSISAKSSNTHWLPYTAADDTPNLRGKAQHYVATACLISKSYYDPGFFQDFQLEGGVTEWLGVQAKLGPHWGSEVWCVTSLLGGLIPQRVAWPCYDFIKSLPLNGSTLHSLRPRCPADWHIRTRRCIRT